MSNWSLPKTAQTCSAPVPVPEAGPQRESSAYVTSIDSLRAVAVIAVMVYHLHGAWLPGGFAGVDVFFVISGYVISRSMVSFSNLEFARFAGKFYSRRIRRIVPALLFCLLITTLLSTMFIPRAWLSDLNTRTGFAAFWGVSNFTLMFSQDNYFAPRVEFNPFTHTWSLGVEEQFYVLFPTLFYFWLRFRRNESFWGRISRYLLLLLILLSFIYSVYSSWQAPLFAYYGLPSRFWELAVGALLFQFHHLGIRLAGRGPTFDRAQLGISVAMLIAGLWLAREVGFPFPWAIPAVIGTLGLIDLLTADSVMATGSNSWLSWAPAVWVGKLSYSLYLWHWPSYVLARWTVGLESWSTQLAAVTATFLLAWISYVLVENPFRRGPLLQKVRPFSVIVGGLSCVLAGWSAAHVIEGNRGRLSLSVTQRNSDDWYPNHAPLVQGKGPLGNCQTPEFRVESIGNATVTVLDHPDCEATQRMRTVFVPGDSHALAYETMLSKLARSEPYNVRIYYSGCPVINLIAPMAEDSPHCRQFFESALSDITSRIRPGDVIFVPTLRLQRFGDQWATGSEAVARERMFGKSAVAARAGAVVEADTILERMLEHGGMIVLEAPPPVFRAPAFRCGDWFNRSNPICAGLKMPREYLLEFRKPVVDAMELLSQRHEGVYIWDPFPTLCPGMTCEAIVNGAPLFLDGDHLSGHGNNLLYPEFVSFLKSHSDVR